MIGRLRGILIEKKPPQLLLDVNGMGYEISAPLSTFYHLPEINHELILFTHLVVREDAHHLFGFYKEQERVLFRALIKVNGVGPKLALTILSGMEPDHFVRCVLDEDASSLVKIPGIGKKTAERLIIETRDHLSQWNVSSESSALSESSMPSEFQLTPHNKSLQDAMSALMALGYKPHEAKQAVMQIQTPELSSEELIRLALRQMVRG